MHRIYKLSHKWKQHTTLPLASIVVLQTKHSLSTDVPVTSGRMEPQHEQNSGPVENISLIEAIAGV